jgi:hypothetical protein
VTDIGHKIYAGTGELPGRAGEAHVLLNEIVAYLPDYGGGRTEKKYMDRERYMTAKYRVVAVAFPVFPKVPTLAP